MSDPNDVGWLAQLRARGVLRVAASYAVIAWLLLQIADVTFEPMGLPAWAMPALIVAAALGFPVALLLAWFLELGDGGVSRDTAPAGQPRPRVHGMRRYADLVVIGGLVAVVGVLLVKDSDLGRPAPPAEPAIAVLPFENLSGDADQVYFSDGLAEEVLDRLGRVPGLKVIARASSFDFRGGEHDVTEIAAKLGVTTLLAGSVRRDGMRLRLTARLLDGATGQQLWSDSFNRDLHDVFAVQAELAAAVVNALVPAARGELALDPAPPTTSLDAYDLYLAARAQLPLRLPEAIEKAVELGEAVVRLDPDFARGQAHLANALIFQVIFFDEADQDRSPERLKRAEAAIYKALSLEPDLSEAHGAYANLLRETGRPGAEEEYRRALELNPNNAPTWHDYAFFLSRFPERRDESFKATARSLELDPRQPNTWANYLSGLGGPYNPRFREAFARALSSIGDIPFAVDRITLPDLSLMGFPVEVAEAAVIKARSPSIQDLPVWINLARAWLPVDPVRAATFIPAEAGFRRPSPSTLRTVDMEAIRLMIDADLAGLAGDWPRLERRWAELDARPGVSPERLAGVKAFWMAVLGRHDEAATWLARAEPIPDAWLPPVMGSSNAYGLMDTMRPHILRATGRGGEAAQETQARLAVLREQRAALGDGCGEPAFDGWISLAGIAAVEGLRDEAVDALAVALRCGDLPPGFNPDWPWFRELDGYPPYEALKQERLRRIERIRQELLRIENEPGLAEALKRAASSSG
jgi:TolB-like protein